MCMSKQTAYLGASAHFIEKHGLNTNWQTWFEHGLNTLPNVQFGDLEVQFDDFPLQWLANLGF